MAASREVEAEDGGCLQHFLDNDGEYVLWVLQAKGLVQKAARLHDTSVTATAALGRVLMGTLLISASKEEDISVQVTFQGNGPLGQVMAIANGRGWCKGRLENEKIEADLQQQTETDQGGMNLNVGAAIGQGVVTVVRKNNSLKQYTGGQQQGITAIKTGEIAEDLAQYLLDSEQINSALGLGVVVGKDQRTVDSAGGYLLQVLPGIRDSTLERLEKNISEMPPVTQLLSEGASLHDIASRIMCGGGGPDSSGHSFTEIKPELIHYGPCNTKDLKGRMVNTLKMLPVTEVRTILEDQGCVEMECDFCREKVVFTEKDLEQEGIIGTP
jgi:molecular chaperone Hsp33